MPVFYLTKASAKFEVATFNGLGGEAFTRKYIFSLLTLTLGQEQTRDVIRYSLHHMTYAPAKFEVCPTVYEVMNLHETFDLTLTQDQGHIRHCHLHHVTYVPAKFEVARANG